jgi:hypothetical protein
VIEQLEATIAAVSAEIEMRLCPFAVEQERLQTIPGIGMRTAQVVLAEIGPDVSRFPSAGHLASWAGMCPGNDESAGKRRSGRTRKGNRWLRAALIEAAHAAARSKGTYLAAQYRLEVGVGFDLRGVDVQLPPPDQPGVLAQVDDLLEEPGEDLDAQPLPNAGQAGMIRKLLVQGVAQVPAVGEVEAGRLDQLPFGADALEEQDELELEEDHWVDAGPAAIGVQLSGPLTHEPEIEPRL